MCALYVVNPGLVDLSFWLDLKHALSPQRSLLINGLLDEPATIRSTLLFSLGYCETVSHICKGTIAVCKKRFVPVASCPTCDHNRKQYGSIFSFSSIRFLQTLIRFPWDFSRLNSPSSLSLFTCKRSFSHLLGPIMDCSNISFSYTGESRTAHHTPALTLLVLNRLESPSDWQYYCLAYQPLFPLYHINLYHIKLADSILCPLSRSLIKKLICDVPRIESWDIPQVIFTPMITIIWASCLISLQSSSLSAYLTYILASNLWGCYGRLCESLTKVL